MPAVMQGDFAYETVDQSLCYQRCSMDASDMLLAAGGKNGHASVFGIQQALVSCVTSLCWTYCLTTTDPSTCNQVSDLLPVI